MHGEGRLRPQLGAHASSALQLPCRSHLLTSPLVTPWLWTVRGSSKGLWPARSTSSRWTARISASRGWVILPASYRVNNCKAQCVYPLGHRINTSHHTSFLSFPSHYKVNPDISRPSWVSNKLNAVSFLYIKEPKTQLCCGSMQTLVEGCGCQ